MCYKPCTLIVVSRLMVPSIGTGMLISRPHTRAWMVRIKVIDVPRPEAPAGSTVRKRSKTEKCIIHSILATKLCSSSPYVSLPTASASRSGDLPERP